MRRLLQRWTAAAAVLLVMTQVTAHAADKDLSKAVTFCRDEAPDNAPESGFAPFNKRDQVGSVGPDTYSQYDRLQVTYPKGEFRVRENRGRGLQYYVTLPGGGAPDKQFAWTILSVPRVINAAERMDGTLWDAVIFERERDFSSLLRGTVGESATTDFIDAKGRSKAIFRTSQRSMATFTLVTGELPKQAVTTAWQRLLGKWAMNQVILPTHPKKRAGGNTSDIGYDHIAYLHPLTPNIVSAKAKYRFVSEVDLGALGFPAFAFVIDSDGKCLAASSISIGY